MQQLFYRWAQYCTPCLNTSPGRRELYDIVGARFFFFSFSYVVCILFSLPI